MALGMCNETFNTLLKGVGILLVLAGFIMGRIDLMLLGIFLVLLVLSNMLTCESYELSNQIGDIKKEIKEELHKVTQESI